MGRETHATGGVRIEHARDVGMIHQREGLALRLEAGDDFAGVHAELDHFQRGAADDGLLLLGHIDDAATALADFLEELVASNAVAGFFGGHDHRARFGVWFERGGGHHLRGVVEGAEESLDAGAQRGVAGAGFVKEGGARGAGGLVERGGEDRFGGEVGVVHGEDFARRSNVAAMERMLPLQLSLRRAVRGVA